MRARVIVMSAAVVAAGSLTLAQAPTHFNPMVDLLAAKKPVFGLYAPSNRRMGGGPPGVPGAAPRPAAPPADAPPTRTQAQLAREAVEFANSDFIFDGSMEGDFERALPPFTELMHGMTTAGILITSPKPHLSKSVVVKTHFAETSMRGVR